jgi:hypothetical protein
MFELTTTVLRREQATGRVGLLNAATKNGRAQTGKETEDDAHAV